MVFRARKNKQRRPEIIPERVIRRIIEQLELTVPGFTYMIERFTIMNYDKSFWSDVFPYNLYEAYNILKEYFSLRKDMAKTIMYEILRIMFNDLNMIYDIMDKLENGDGEEANDIVKRYFEKLTGGGS